MARKSDPVPAALVRAREKFESWRSRREGRRIPAVLWAEAARLADRFGVHRTASELRLNGTTLKQHMSATPRVSARVRPAFVEVLPGPGESVQEHGCAELIDSVGNRVRVEWHRTPPDLAALTRGFFGARA